MPYVYSTMTAATTFAIWAKGSGDIPRQVKSITIHGGANAANGNLYTPHGVVTEVTDEELTELRKLPIFGRMEARGYIKVDSKKHDPDNVASDMTAKDNSAPLTDTNVSSKGDADWAPAQQPATSKAKK